MRIDALEEYFEQRRAAGLPSAADLDHVAEEQQVVAATASSAVDQADGFGEPWVHVSGEYETIEDRAGRTVVDMTGSELTEEDDIEYARRIRACVNACEGFPTEDLENHGAGGLGIFTLVRIRPEDFEADALPSFRRLLAQACERFGVTVDNFLRGGRTVAIPPLVDQVNEVFERVDLKAQLRDSIALVDAQKGGAQ
jgi:hypothetical protein